MLNKLRQASQFINLAGPLCIQHPHPHRTLHSLRRNFNKFNHGDSVSLILVVPPSKETQVLECETTDELTRFIKLYKGELTTLSKNGSTKIIPPSKYSEVSPSTVYEIKSPFFTSIDEDRRHYKAFEDKSRLALIRYLDEHQRSFHELNRVIKVDGRIVAEWEGVFELESGEVWFLECKHCV